jgi:EmrB/QacA subfamily drug resistance transporter
MGQEQRYAWRVFSVTSIGVLLAAANTSTLDVALPVVARHFHASASAAAWMLLSYMLVYTILILALGRLADIIGRRRLYLIGLGTLTAASVGCGFAPNIVILDVFRSVQAVGAAAIITNTTAQLVDAFPPRLLSTGLGLNVTMGSAAQVLGPLLGGLLATTLGWRAVFWFNVPTGLAGLIWARRTLRRPLRSQQREPFDFAGALLSAIMLSGLIVGLSQAGASGWTSTSVLGGLATFVLATPVFILVQRRRQHPLVDLGLFADRTRALAYVAAFLLAAARSAVVLLVALYLQAARGLDAFQAGLRITPVAIGVMVASPVAGRLARRFDARILSTAGMALTGTGLLTLAIFLSPDLAYLPIAIALLAIGVGSGLFLTPNTTAIMTSVADSRRGVANGVRAMVQNSGYIISIALALSIVTSSLHPDEKRAAYSGTLSRLSFDGLVRFTHGYHMALYVLTGVTFIGCLASVSRSVDPERQGRISASDVGVETMA